MRKHNKIESNMRFVVIVFLLFFSLSAYSQAYVFDAHDGFADDSKSGRELLSKPFPNPVRVSAQINYTLPENTSKGVIVIFNLLGNEVRRIKVDNSQQHITIKAGDFKNGTYFYQLEYNGTYTKTKRLIISK